MNRTSSLPSTSGEISLAISFTVQERHQFAKHMVRKRKGASQKETPFIVRSVQSDWAN